MYERIISVPNLELAWRRITTARNLQYKRFFRSLYAAFEVAHREHLLRLREQLIAGWTPSSPHRAYLPKPSGLQRPISLLDLEDQIVLQAVANVFAKKLRKRRNLVEGQLVFSNLLTSSPDSIFFLKDWRRTYAVFQRHCQTLFSRDLRWIAHFDIAAFYDTLSHEQLLRRIAPRGGAPDTLSRLRVWLRAWAAQDPSQPLDHGIPQGPLASDFLAECFLLPLDEEMNRAGVNYVRYVDDIRIFASSRFEAQQAAVRLEVICRSLGLSPQGKKFRIEEATSVEEALGHLPSIAPPDNVTGGAELRITTDRAERLFSEALVGRPYRIADKSKARYVLYRSPPSRKLRNWVALLLPRHPEHIDAFVHYLTNHSRSVEIERVAKAMLSDGTPYTYVRAELWHVLARIGGAATLREMRERALQDLAEHKDSLPLEWGCLAFLIACEEAGLGRVRGRVKRARPLTQALLAPAFPEGYFEAGGPVGELLSSSDYHAGIASAVELPSRRLTHRDFGHLSRDLTPAVQATLRELRIIRSPGLGAVDQIATVLAARYDCLAQPIWRPLLGQEYGHALQILRQADALFDSHRSQWLQYQNSFNDAATRAFVGFLAKHGLPGTNKLVRPDGGLVKFGSIVQPNGPCDRNHGVFAGAMRSCNDRRNKLPGSHPYDDKGGAKNTFLRKAEQNTLRVELQAAYNYLVSFVAARS